MTFNERGQEMMDKLDDMLDVSYPPKAKRDLALSRTHLEDALTRFNSAQYRIKGTWVRSDPEKEVR